MTIKIGKKRKYEVSINVDNFGKPFSFAPDIVTKLDLNDVLFGRGAQINHYEGNRRFRELIKLKKDEYSATTNRQLKDAIAREIITIILSKNGRFLKRYEDTDHSKQHLTKPSFPSNSTSSTSMGKGAVTAEKAQSFKDKVWISVNPEIAVEKAKQALRDQECKGNSNTTGSLSQPEFVDKSDIANFRLGTSLIRPREEQQREDKSKPRLLTVAGTNISRLRKLMRRRTETDDDSLETENADEPGQYEFSMIKASRNQEYKQAGSSISRLRELQSKLVKSEDSKEDELQRPEKSSNRVNDQQEIRVKNRGEERVEQNQSKFDALGRSVSSVREQLIQQLQANSESLKQLQAVSQLQFAQPSPSVAPLLQQRQDLIPNLDQRNSTLHRNFALDASMLYPTLLQQTHPLLHGNLFLAQRLGSFNTFPSSSIGMDISLYNQKILNAAGLARQYGQISDGRSGMGCSRKEAALSDEIAGQHAERNSLSAASLASLFHHQQHQLQPNSDKAAAASMFESPLLRQSNINGNLPGLPIGIDHVFKESTFPPAVGAFHGPGSNVGHNCATKNLDLIAVAADASSYNRSMVEGDVRSSMIRDLLQRRGSIDANLD